MAVERCSGCGLPIYVRLAAAWNDDGTITGRYVHSTRVVQVYFDELDSIFDGISERIGLDITRIVVEGERKAGLAFTNTFLSKWKGIVGRIATLPLVVDIVMRFVVRTSKNAGFGCISIISHKRNKQLVLKITDPFSPAVIAGNILGSFEAFSGGAATVDWEGDAREIRIAITSGGEREPIDKDRLEPRLPVVLPGEYTVERCRKCGMPLDLTNRYDFDLAAGIATERGSGGRIVTVMIDSLEAVFEELYSELGREVAQMVVDLESDYVQRSITMPACVDECEAIEELLSDLRIKGMGNPTEISLVDDELLVRIENPFNEELVAGRVLGIYRALLGEPAEIRWTDEEGFMFVKVLRP